MHVRFKELMLVGVLVCLGVAVAKAAFAQAPGQVVDLTLSSAGVEFTNVVGATTENFDNVTTGDYKTLTAAGVGTWTTSSGPGMAIVAANEYGGGSESLNGTGGTGNYAAVGDSDTVKSGSYTLSSTLTFTQPESYFGAWWSALDGNNQLQLYSGTTLIDTLNETSLTALVNQQQNGGKPYYGNPNGPYTGQDNNEPFSYLNFYGLNGQTFTSAVFTQTSTNADFEFDNVSVATNYSNPGITGTQVFTPEPTETLALSIGCAVLFILLMLARRRTPTTTSLFGN